MTNCLLTRLQSSFRTPIRVVHFRGHRHPLKSTNGRPILFYKHINELSIVHTKIIVSTVSKWEGNALKSNVMKSRNNCVGCENTILNEEIIKRSIKDFGVLLCKPCQSKHIHGLRKSAVNANRLFFALRARRIEAILAYDDGYKTVDIFIEKSRLHIEVDGDQHNTDANQALADLQRTYYSFSKGYFTLRVPNSLVKRRLSEAINYIVYIIDLLDQNNRDNIFKRA